MCKRWSRYDNNVITYLSESSKPKHYENQKSENQSSDNKIKLKNSVKKS
jgi:hypothetical protein